DLRDLIELTQTGTDPASGLLLFSPRNVARARTQGVDAGIMWNGSGRYAGAEYSRLNARDRGTGRPLDRRASETARLRLGTPFPGFGALRTDATLSYTGRAPAVQPDGSDGVQERFLSVNLQLQYRLPGGLAFSMGGDNLLNGIPAGWTGVMGRRIYAGLSGAWRP
ncbi:MAG TPA: TonB-dependent receptor, partial [Gemmatimonadales bacterium]